MSPSVSGVGGGREWGGGGLEGWGVRRRRRRRGRSICVCSWRACSYLEKADCAIVQDSTGQVRVRINQGEKNVRMAPHSSHWAGRWGGGQQRASCKNHSTRWWNPQTCSTAIWCAASLVWGSMQLQPVQPSVIYQWNNWLFEITQSNSHDVFSSRYDCSFWCQITENIYRSIKGIMCIMIMFI